MQGQALGGTVESHGVCPWDPTRPRGRDIDGQTVVTRLKQIPGLQNTPIVAITAWPAEQALTIAERYGLTGCILKPIDVAGFPQQIATFLDQSGPS